MLFSRLMAWVARETSNSGTRLAFLPRLGTKKCAVVPSTICVSPTILSDHAYRGDQRSRRGTVRESSRPMKLAQRLQGRPLEWGWYGSGVCGLENGRG